MINEDKEPIVKIDKLPAYEVVNPTEEDKEKAADEQGVDDTIVKKGSEAAKEEKKEDKVSSDSALKQFTVKLLDDMKEFIKNL